MRNRERGRGKLVRVLNRTRGTCLAERAEVAESFFDRGRGLLGRSGLAAGEGLVLLRCNWVHSFLMAFACSLVYLSREGRVLRAVDRFPPNRVEPPVWRAHYVVELPAGVPTLTGTVPGDVVDLEPLASIERARFD